MMLVLSDNRRRRFIAALMMLGLLLGATLAVAANVATGVSLTQSEQEWLDRHPVIVLAPQAGFYPFEFFDDKGNYRGVAADYVALLEQRLGVRFKILHIENPDQWQAMIKSSGVDLVAAAQASAPIEGMRITRPHIVFPGVIVAKDEYQDLGSLAGIQVAVVDGQQWGPLITGTYPEIPTLVVPDTVTALELISQGSTNALISDMATASYYIHREGMTGIRIVGRLDKNLELGIATRKDWPELNRIMEKALASISDAEHEKISRQWIHLKVPSLVLGSTFWLLLSSALATVVLAFLGFIFWNRSLRQQVAQRTQTLKEELQWRTAAEMELQDAHESLIQSHEKLKETQLQLIRAAKMESVGSLAAGIAHEVKNPLTQIRLGLDYLQEGFAKDQIGQGIVKDMVAAVGRADSVINSLLDFSRESKLLKSKCSLNRIIEDSLYLVRHDLAQAGIQIIRELQDPLPEALLDENKMHQVFINLFLNAAQAMPSGGTLQIATFQRDSADQAYPLEGNIDGVSAPVKRVLVAEVTDSGPGINNETMGKIFDPFYTTKPVGKGTGLGLYVTKNILDLHGAEIKLSNREGGGLSVRILFPIE